MNPSRRGFLLGSLGALSAALVARSLPAALLDNAQPALVVDPPAAAPETWRRLVASWDMLERGAVDIEFSDIVHAQITGPQLEEGAFPTSYIATQARPERREADYVAAPVPFDIRDPSAHLMVSCSRPTLATYFDGERIVTVPPNTPRLTPQGLLVEEARTNLLLYSERPMSQRVHLDRPRPYTFSCYVKGHLEVRITTPDGRSFVATPAPK